MWHQKKDKARRTETEVSRLSTSKSTLKAKHARIDFFELEAAVVIDVIRDEEHPVFLFDETSPHVDSEEWPTGYNEPMTADYSWIGRVKVRMLQSQQQKPAEELDWVKPLETALVEYPLVNEVVIISKYEGSLHYSRRLNSRNFINNSANPRTEHRYGMSGGITSEISANLVGARNESNLGPEQGKFGKYLGKYFKANNKIRPLKHFEGDTILQSRHGSSIRFGCYEDNPKIDVGTQLGYGESHDENLGNPMILIRNRQKLTNHPETLFQYNILENINEDGSSIHITSGLTISKFVPTITHTYENVPYGCVGCNKTGFVGFDTLARSKIGVNRRVTNLSYGKQY